MKVQGLTTKIFQTDGIHVMIELHCEELVILTGNNKEACHWKKCINK